MERPYTFLEFRRQGSVSVPCSVGDGGLLPVVPVLKKGGCRFDKRKVYDRYITLDSEDLLRLGRVTEAETPTPQDQLSRSWGRPMSHY